MSQAGYTPIQLYYSTTASAVPSAGNLANGEPALNITDGKLYYKNNSGVVTLLASAAGASGDVVGPGSSTDNALVRFDSTTGKLVQNSVGILDDSGNLTGIAALTTSGALTLNGGTANGVAYLNGSKVLTTGSALTFDGTNLALGGYGRTTGTGWQVLNNGLLTTYGANASGTLINNLDGGPIQFQISSAEQMRLNSTGLGIGTSSPAAKLDVNGAIATSASGGSSLLFRTSGTTNYSWANQYPSAGNFSLYDHSAGATVLTVSSGNLGLGVTPSAWSSSVATQVGYGAALSSRAAGNTASDVTHGAYWNGTNWLYQYSSVGASRYQMTGANAGSTHAWFVSAGGTAGNAISFTQAMTLDASGNLGVGTTSPISRFHVNSSSTNTTAITVGNNNGGTQIGFDSTNASFVSAYSTTALRFGNNSGATFVETARIDSNGNLLVGVTSGESTIIQKNTNTTRATIRVISACATTGNQFGLAVELNGDPNNADQYLFAGRGGVGGSTDRCVIRSNGGIANYQANNVNLSDRREKTNFAPAKSYLETICAIPVQTFNYIDQNMEDDPGLTLGVAAQDVQAVAPELVMESDWGTEDNPKQRLSIYQTDLQYALMKALQELKAEFDAYKASHP